MPELWGGYATLGESIRYGFFQVVAIITTTGFGTANFNQWPEGSKVLLVLLMFVGGCGGSTGGGLKVIRWITLVKVALHQIEKVYRPRRVRMVKIGSTIVDEELQVATLSFFLIAILICAASTFVVALSGVDIVTSATAVVATFNNIGPGLARVGSIENFAFFSQPTKVWLAFLMAMGRLELFSILVLFIPKFWRT
jgi:trk system potassium uptake protein TrkH